MVVKIDLICQLLSVNRVMEKSTVMSVLLKLKHSQRHKFSTCYSLNIEEQKF